MCAREVTPVVTLIMAMAMLIRAVWRRRRRRGQRESEEARSMPNLKIVTAAREPERDGERRAEWLRLLEAMRFASAEPLDEKSLAAQLPEGIDVHAALLDLQKEYAARG